MLRGHRKHSNMAVCFGLGTGAVEENVSYASCFSVSIETAARDYPSSQGCHQLGSAQVSSLLYESFLGVGKAPCLPWSLVAQGFSSGDGSHTHQCGCSPLHPSCGVSSTQQYCAVGQSEFECLLPLLVVSSSPLCRYECHHLPLPSFFRGKLHVVDKTI